MQIKQLFAKHAAAIRELIRKFREGSLTMDDTLGGYSFFVFVFPFLVPAWISLFVLDGEMGSMEDKRVEYFFAVFFVMFFFEELFVFSRSLPKRPSLGIKIIRVLGAATFAALFAFFGQFYFSLWNALTGSDENILVSGPVVHMEVSSGRWAGKVHYATINYGGRDVTLILTTQEYARLREGETYERQMKLGGLGYYYTWGVPWWR